MLSPSKAFLCAVALIAPNMANGRTPVPKIIDWRIVRSAAVPMVTRGLARRAADSLVITVINGMGHPMNILYEKESTRTPLGTVDPAGTLAVVIRQVQGDSVKLWAVSDAMPEFSEVFSTHPAKPLVWSF